MTKQTIVVGGPEQPEPECTVAPTGTHCWHPTGGHMIGEGGAYKTHVCCFCNALKHGHVFTHDPAQHGRYLPDLWWMR